MKKQLKLVTALSAAALLSAAAPVLFSGLHPLSAVWAAQGTGWVNEDGEWRYLESDGYYMSDDWKRRDGDWYYLDDKGYVAKNTRVDDYYVDENGKRVREAWIAIDNEEYWDLDLPDQYWYYFGKDEKVTTSKWLTLDGKTYYFNEDGHMVTGLVEIEGEQYYFGNEHDGVRKTGWIEMENDNMDLDLDTVWHYFDSKGRMIVNAIDYRIDGEYYTFVDGIMQTGWFKLPAAEVATDSNAQPVADEVTMKDYQYYEGSGKRASGWYLIEGVPGISEQGDEYYFYFRNGAPYYADKGIQLFLISAKRYAFNTRGEMQSGLQTVNLEDGTTARVYLDSSGAAYSGKRSIYNEDLAMDQTWFFSTEGSRKGLGVQGIRDNAIYLDGLRQDAYNELRYAPVALDGVSYLVNASGTIQKSTAGSTSQAKPELGRGFKDYRDTEGTVWVVNVEGVIQ